MSLLPITLAAENYDRTRGLIDGSSSARGHRPELHPAGGRGDLLADDALPRIRCVGDVRHGVSHRADAARAAVHRDPGLSVAHVPALGDLHSGRTAASSKPADLAGRRVGVPEYGLTALTWVRAFLQHDYGVHPSRSSWMVGGEEQPGREERAPFQPPPDVTIEPIPPDETLSSMIVAGDDRRDHRAAHAEPVRGGLAAGPPPVPRLPKVEEDYYRRTGLFPIMHFAVIRADVYRRHPWVAESLYKAFCAGERAGDARTFSSRTCSFARSRGWCRRWSASATIFGHDLWPYGVAANRRTLEAMVAYHVEQGIIPKAIPVEELFAESTLVEFKI